MYLESLSVRTASLRDTMHGNFSIFLISTFSTFFEYIVIFFSEQLKILNLSHVI